MTLHRAALYVLAAAAVAGWAAAAWQARKVERITEADRVGVLHNRGYQPLDVSRNPPKELRGPVSEKPVTIVRIEAQPTEAEPPAVEPFTCPEAGAVQTAPNWTLRPGDLGLEDGLVRVDRAGLALFTGTLTAQTPQGPVRRVLEPQDVHLEGWLSSEASSPDRFFALRPRPMRHWRAGWFAGPGLALSRDGTVRAAVLVGWGAQF